MRRCAQSPHRSTCPPNAAVRQRSIADMTFSWPRLTWPAWDARQAGPRWRKMSATSTAGRDNGRALAGHLQQEVERSRPLAYRANGDTCVERRRVELLVSEQNLEDPDIGLLLQEMGGKAVPQRMDTDTLGNASACRCHANEPVKVARTDVLPAVAGKQPGLAGRHPSLLARDAPPFAQQLEKVGREDNIPILLAFALFDPDDHAVPVDIGELQRYDLRCSQASGVSQAQGEAPRLADRHDLVGKIAALQCDLEEKPQGTGSGVDGRYRRSDRRQPQLIPMDVLRSGLGGKAAKKIPE